MKLRHCLASFLLIGCFLACSFVEAGSYQRFCETSKIYVDPHQVRIFPEHFSFVNEAGETEITYHLFCDEGGVYTIGPHYQCLGCGKWARTNFCVNTSCPLYSKVIY
ncbi:hypothetical protein PHSC3_000377 [Chlamydiales bacterium STE3]|nr:hypothetical protein PHSC3_000377 [Chlamydiales bacterium STE3]